MVIYMEIKNTGIKYERVVFDYLQAFGNVGGFLEISLVTVQILNLFLAVSLNAAPCYLEARDTCANLIDKAQLCKSYRQGTIVQIL